MFDCANIVYSILRLNTIFGISWFRKLKFNNTCSYKLSEKLKWQNFRNIYSCWPFLSTGVKSDKMSAGVGWFVIVGTHVTSAGNNYA